MAYKLSPQERPHVFPGRIALLALTISQRHGETSSATRGRPCESYQGAGAARLPKT